MWDFKLLKTISSENDNEHPDGRTNSNQNSNKQSISPRSVSKLQNENKQLRKDNNYLYKYIQDLECQCNITTTTSTSVISVTQTHHNEIVNSPLSTTSLYGNNLNNLKSPAPSGSSNLTKVKYINNLNQTIKQLKIEIESKSNQLQEKETLLSSTYNTLQDVRVEALQVLPLQMKLKELKQNELNLKQQHLHEKNHLKTEMESLQLTIDKKEKEVNEFKEKTNELNELQNKYIEASNNCQCKSSHYTSQSVINVLCSILYTIFYICCVLNNYLYYIYHHCFNCILNIIGLQTEKYELEKSKLQLNSIICELEKMCKAHDDKNTQLVTENNHLMKKCQSLLKEIQKSNLNGNLISSVSNSRSGDDTFLKNQQPATAGTAVVFTNKCSKKCIDFPDQQQQLRTNKDDENENSDSAVLESECDRRTYKDIIITITELQEENCYLKQQLANHHQQQTHFVAATDTAESDSAFCFPTSTPIMKTTSKYLVANKTSTRRKAHTVNKSRHHYNNHSTACTVGTATTTTNSNYGSIDTEDTNTPGCFDFQSMFFPEQSSHLTH